MSQVGRLIIREMWRKKTRVVDLNLIFLVTDFDDKDGWLRSSTYTRSSIGITRGARLSWESSYLIDIINPCPTFVMPAKQVSYYYIHMDLLYYSTYSTQHYFFITFKSHTFFFLSILIIEVRY